MTQPLTSGSDWIEISDLTVHSRIGVYAWERVRRRPLRIHARLGLDLSAAGQHDAITQSIDYATLCEEISDFATGSDVQLIETFAERLCGQLLAAHPIDWITLGVEKPRAVVSATVKVQITRHAAKRTTPTP